MSDVTGIKLVVDKSPEESVSLSNRAVVGTTQSGFSSRYIHSVLEHSSCLIRSLDDLW